MVDWILAPLSAQDRDAFTQIRSSPGKHGKAIHKSFDCSIMDLADDIAFGVHDLEDALALGLIGQDAFRRAVTEAACAPFLTRLKEKYPREFGNDVYEGFVTALFGESGRRKRFIGRMVNHFITHVGIETLDDFAEPLIRYRAVLKGGTDFLDALKTAVRDAVILSPIVQQLEFKGQRMVVGVFEALTSEPRAFLPASTRARWEASDTPERVICDHIAGMTDAFLLKTWERLFAPRMGSVFERI